MGFLRWNGIRPTYVRAIPCVFFGLILVFGTAVRFHGLGERSLWGDEFCTWKVAQMPAVESLRWQPELTKPPLYQFAVRCVARLFAEQCGAKVHQDAPYTDVEDSVPQNAPHAVPSEWHLRLPAAVSGLLTVAAMWWLGSMAGSWVLGAAGALLLAVNALQIDYSQEARPYSMLVLGSIVSTGIWYRFIARQQGNKATRQLGKVGWAVAYVLVTALSFHANYLIMLTVVAHALWAAHSVSNESEISNLKSQIRALVAPATVMVATAMLCVPMVWHFLRYRTSVFQGLDWIAAPTVRDSVKVLGEITFGPIWVVCLLGTAVLLIVRYTKAQIDNRKSKIENGPRAADERRWTQIFGPACARNDYCGLLLVWLVAAWGGLLVISWVAHPAMVARYALPAAAPAILLPLIVLHRWDRRLPLLIAALFVIGTAPVWATRTDRVKPGFREMLAFLNEYADPQREAVVVVIERTTSPGWEEMDLLGFEYYESSKFKVQSSKKQGNDENSTSPHHHITTSPRFFIEILYLRYGRPDGDQPILRDPRALWMVTFLADPMEAIESAGRRVEQIEIEDKFFEQLYFEPYRLIRVVGIE